jgi:thiol-disulfide isomerase/thioredoxin
MFRSVRRALPALAFTACGLVDTTTSEPVIERGKGGDATVCDPALYPCGPYGYQPGSVIEDLSLVARVDGNGDGRTDAADPVGTIPLSRYFQDKNIYALVMTGSAEWCGPCQAEQPGLKELYESYEKAGGHLAILETIIQDANYRPSTIAVADRWKSRFQLPFDVAADPSVVLSPYYDINAFPMNMVIRTSDMKIVWQSNGGGTEAEAELRRQVDRIVKNPQP